jgi:hypothetical protein
LEQIVRELHMMNRVLERMVQAPIFDKRQDNDDYLERMGIYMDDTPQEKQSI